LIALALRQAVFEHMPFEATSWGARKLFFAEDHAGHALVVFQLVV
jgi:hypothetical protein